MGCEATPLPEFWTRDLINSKVLKVFFRAAAFHSASYRLMGYILMTRGLTFVSSVSAKNQYLASKLSLKCCYDTDARKTNLSRETKFRISERLAETLHVTNPLNHRVYSAQRPRGRHTVQQRLSYAAFTERGEFVFLKTDAPDRAAAFTETQLPAGSWQELDRVEVKDNIQQRAGKNSATGSGDPKLWRETSFCSLIIFKD